MNTTFKLPHGHLTIKTRRHLSAAERFRDLPIVRVGVFYLAWAPAPPAARPPRVKPAPRLRKAPPTPPARIEPQMTRW